MSRDISFRSISVDESSKDKIDAVLVTVQDRINECLSELSIPASVQYKNIYDSWNNTDGLIGFFRVTNLSPDSDKNEWLPLPRTTDDNPQ